MSAVEVKQLPTDLDLPDLQKLLELLSLAARRGAFDLEEYEDVGGVYRRVAAFLRRAPG